MTGDTLTIDELQAYKAKAKRQRDNWKRRAVKYRNERDALKDEMEAYRNAFNLVKDSLANGLVITAIDTTQWPVAAISGYGPPPQPEIGPEWGGV
jgi:hypothetical protein